MSGVGNGVPGVWGDHFEASDECGSESYAPPAPIAHVAARQPLPRTAKAAAIAMLPAFRPAGEDEENEMDVEIDAAHVAAAAAKSKKTAAAASAGPTCGICRDATADHVCTPCFHVVYCGSCAEAADEHHVTRCPVCRGHVDAVHKLFFPGGSAPAPAPPDTRPGCNAAAPIVLD